MNKVDLSFCKNYYHVATYTIPKWVILQVSGWIVSFLA